MITKRLNERDERDIFFLRGPGGVDGTERQHDEKMSGGYMMNGNYCVIPHMDGESAIGAPRSNSSSPIASRR
jgi:hypothetical protein